MIDRLEELERIAEVRRQREEGTGDAQPQPHRTVVDDRDAQADTRLHAADALLAEARELVAADATRDDTAEGVRRAIDEMYMGNADQAAEALAAAVRPDPKALAAEVLREVDLQAGLKRFKQDYPQILADVHLARLADAYYDKARAAGHSESEALDAAGRETLAHLRRAAEGSGIRIADGADEPASIAETGGASAIAEMAAQRIGAIRPR